MAAITRLSLGGYGAQRAGSFAGKPAYISVTPATVSSSIINKISLSSSLISKSLQTTLIG